MSRPFPLLASCVIVCAFMPINLLSAAPDAAPEVRSPVAIAPTSVPAQDLELLPAPTHEEVDEKFPIGPKLDGEEIYDRFLENRRRLRSARQEGRILSTDDGGGEQLVRYEILGKDYRDENDDPVNNELSRILIRVVGPMDIDKTGYLYIDLEEGEDQQFMYSPHRRRTSRVTLRGQTVAGTDFSFDDFLLSLDEIEDADYQRHDNEMVGETPCYVVETFMKEAAKSSYSRTKSWIEKEHYVPLKTISWDMLGIEVKLLESPRESIREYDGIWIAQEGTITDLLESTSSTMYIDTLIPRVEVDDSDVSVQALQFSH
jgi:hypothetical protein